MKFLIYLLLSAFLFSCSQAKLLQLSTQEGDEKATITELKYTSKEDVTYSALLYFPFPHPTVSSSGFSGGIGTSIRYQKVKYGEANLGFTYRLSDIGKISGDFLPTDRKVFKGELQLGYHYPLFKKSKEKLTKDWLIKDSDKSLYYMIHPTNCMNMFVVRFNANMDYFQHTVNGYTEYLKSIYGDNIDIKVRKTLNRAIVDQSSIYVRGGLAWKNIHYIATKVRDEHGETYTGGFNKLVSIYADASFLVGATMDNVEYKYKLYNVDIVESVNMDPYLTKLPIGGCIGYYEEFYLAPNYPLLMSVYVEAGLRPGYYGKTVNAIYGRFGIALGFGKVKK